LDDAIAVSPEVFERYVYRQVRWHRLEDHAHMIEGLRKAGLPPARC
jgi:adenylate cyclase